MAAVASVIHVLTGCTAVGKTALALGWAEANDAEILSCDSLLFYRGMDIGTAKPTREERARVPHHLVDTNAVTEPMDVARYVVLARRAAEGIWARGRRVLVAGGSGFYLRAFFGPVADDIAVPPALREELRERLERKGLDDLRSELQRLNPGGLGQLDPANPRRVVRALERCRASGRTLTELAEAFAAQPGPFADCEVRLVELVRERADLERRIDARVAAMLRDGLVAEVRALAASGLERNPSAVGAIGYRETLAHLHGRLPEAELPAAIAANTRALVRKQKTWFRTQLPEHRKVDAAQAGPGELFA
ncbi:MAG: tRNA (adenosine(37)-N6)-dimethylallyltransferase MiaA [Opitutaceae bacterium]|nr:tRNA (adenosine(37)-N6)-dimethylallyltransferase MiaA [Opitutaceae bacterium]